MDWYRSKGFTPGFPEDIALKCLTLRFWDFKKPSIVAVNGLAVGGAANFALANFHDLVLASSAARFKYPFADLGLTPELGSSYMMPMLTGMTNAKKMMMIGDWFSAEEAKAMGLVLEVTQPEDLVPRAIEMATTLAKKNPDALRLSKQVMNGHLRREMDRVMDTENATIKEAVMSMRQAATATAKPRL